MTWWWLLIALLLLGVLVWLAVLAFQAWRRRQLKSLIEQAVYDEAQLELTCASDSALRQTVRCTVDAWVSKYGLNKVYSLLTGTLTSGEEEDLFQLGLPCAAQYCDPSP